MFKNLENITEKLPELVALQLTQFHWLQKSAKVIFSKYTKNKDAT